MQMNVGGIRSAAFLEQMGAAKSKSADKTRDFRSDLEGNLSGQATEDSVKEQKSAEDTRGAEYYQSVMSARALHNADKLANSAVEACEVRKITYGQCDYVKLCADQGVVYKAQVLREKNQVYVEEKKDDGTVSAYLVDMDKAAQNPSLPLEAAAKEAFEKAQTQEAADTEEEFQHALDKFYVYAEERVKEGPPEFAIGAAEFSVKDWEKMLEAVDEEIDAMKEDLQERIDEKEEDAKKKGIDELVRKRELEKQEGPYAFLKGDGSELVYNGVVFTYDQSGALCLGDTSNPDDVITIYLTDGVFKMNRNSIADLSQAIGMFSPEDINRILRAISQDAKCKKKLNEIEEALFNLIR